MMTSATSQVDAVLPDPDACPGRSVLIYDGHCRFCVANVRILRALDLNGRVAFLSLHDQRVAERYSELSHERLMQEMHLVDGAGAGAGAGTGTNAGTGTIYGGAAAFRRLTRLMPLLWPLAPLLHLPFSLPLWSWLYDIVARHRYRFGRLDGCDNGACAVHFGPRRT